MDRIKRLGAHTFTSLSIKNFRQFFINQAFSQSGMWMQTVALGWFVLETTGSGTRLGFVVALQFLPMLILGPWGGLMADRHNKRTLLIFTQISYAILTGTVGTLMILDMAHISILYVYAALFGCIRLFDTPLRQTFVSELVPSEKLKNAVSLNATINNLARAVGPSIAGIIIASGGTALCFLIIAGAYLGAMGTLLQLPHNTVQRPHTEKNVRKELLEGFRYAWHAPIIRNTLLLIALVGTFAFEFQVSLPILAQHTFSGDARSYALLLTAMGVGAVIGGLFAAGRHRVTHKHLGLYVLCFGSSMLAVAAMPSLILASVGMFVVGFFSINVTSLANTMIQLEAAPHMRGRVMALWVMAMAGSTPIGGPIIGFVAEACGGRAGIALGGGVAIIAALCMLTVERIRVHKIKTEEHIAITSDVQFRTDAAMSTENKVL